MKLPTLKHAGPALLLATVMGIAGCAEAVPNGRAAGPIGADLETLTVAPEGVVRERIWDGVVEAVDQATLSAQTPGRVQELPLDVGDTVEAGQIVAYLTDIEQRSRQRQAEANLRSAEALLAEVELSYERTARMVRDELMPQAAYDQIKARRDTARAALASARAAVREAGEQVAYTQVRSPYAGVIAERLAEVGEAVGAGQPLLTLLSEDRFRVQVRIPQSEAASVREFGRGALLLDDGRRIEAERVTVFPRADAATHSVRVRVDLPPLRPAPMPGSVAKVAFALDEVERLLLPASAVRQRGEVSMVYVVGPEGELSLRQVRPGHRYGDRIEIVAGLAAGERIAANPVAALSRRVAQRQEAARDGF